MSNSSCALTEAGRVDSTVADDAKGKTVAFVRSAHTDKFDGFTPTA